jgi:hypothetical protein
MVSISILVVSSKRLSPFLPERERERERETKAIEN